MRQIKPGIIVSVRPKPVALRRTKSFPQELEEGLTLAEVLGIGPDDRVKIRYLDKKRFGLFEKIEWIDSERLHVYGTKHSVKGEDPYDFQYGNDPEINANVERVRQAFERKKK